MGLAIHYNGGLAKPELLLKRIEELADFTLVDESLYWETGDEKQLRQKMGFLAKMINNMETALNFFPKKEGENSEEYVVRIARKVILKNKREEEQERKTDSVDDKEEEY
ncbi:MAG TPA: hypothetical protein ENN84_06900 [Candidatus Marinimicrobia bacterium]|nr:hypothetical protein [Candidatus Neomarinimicrobiota bacterium]